MSYKTFSHVSEEKKQLSYRKDSKHISKMNTIKTLKTNRNCDNLSVTKKIRQQSTVNLYFSVKPSSESSFHMKSYFIH